MFFFPLGLGLKPPKFPFITILIILVNTVCYLQQSIDNKKLEKYYIEAQKGNKKNLLKFHKENQLLTKNNISLETLSKAQFTHANFEHIFGNMLALFLFGIFLEAKIGSLLYLLIYLLGGALGMYLGVEGSSSELVYHLGASANVYTVIGAFFLLFYRHYMKYFWSPLFPFFGRIIYLPVRYAIPFLMIGLEVVNQIYASTIGATSGVDHLAHIGGFLAGLMLAYFYKQTNPMEHPFFFKEEENLFKKMQKSNSLDKINKIAKKIQTMNPMNYVVRIFVIKKAIEEFKKYKVVTPVANQSFHDNLEPILGRLIWKQDRHGAKSLLQEVPFEFKLFRYIKGLSQRQILKLGDYLLDNNDYTNAFRIYHLFLSLYKGMRVENNLLKTCDSLFQHHVDNPRDLHNIRVLLDSDDENIMSSRYAINDESYEDEDKY